MPSKILWQCPENDCEPERNPQCPNSQRQQYRECCKWGEECLLAFFKVSNCTAVWSPKHSCEPPTGLPSARPSSPRHQKRPSSIDNYCRYEERTQGSESPWASVGPPFGEGKTKYRGGCKGSHAS